jgi:hypothetical protein
MSNVILAQLSSDSFCTALGITVTAAAPVLALCRKLIASSTYASSTPLDAYRGDTLCLKVRSIGEAAQFRMGGTTSGTPVLRREKTVSGASAIEFDAE